ncbi:glycoside hydrolase family 43 protein [Mucilaginibacter ginsenosidivorax]|uniref:Glycosyl hydrolase 43 family protein n=1 Tax=Mucilaginibacter ginsenosidivorax TaxID=862126 RepID=A0A5B8W4A5_9SPHI|nr:glycoside hydrolase 43 family protein [Mucilaginibacter ginsenosidivorax]QEC78563.1 glycosyl hydrolase 43 family protein [Mucilaginibacter ginsenosidivorax]
MISKFSIFRALTCFCFITVCANPVAYAQGVDDSVKWGNWLKWGDQRNGTYRNPVLPADYSDPDCIRVNDDYYAISSTFQFSPGVVILHSNDLVNWSVLGHAVNNLNQLSPEMNWDKMNRYGKGIWAGAIRYHHGKFWVYFGTPDEGYFMTTARDPAGPWEPLHQVLSSPGWDDCCPFWDDDGQGYLIGTNYADDYKIHLFKLTADGRDIVKASDQVIHQSPGSEANKLYKINGWYYHFFSEVKPEGRVVMMERSKNIFGPYIESKQLNHAEKQFNEPNQGGLLQTQDGKWYFLTHHGSGDWSGRVLSLLPVTWANGWPVIGKPGADGIGNMVWAGKMPVKDTAKVILQTDDEFEESQLPPQWEWNYQPKADKWSLSQKPGWLSLHAFKPLRPDDLLKAGNTLTQRCFRTPYNSVTIKIEISRMTDGEKAGLCHFTNPHFAQIGINYSRKRRCLEFKNEKVRLSGPEIKGRNIWLRSTWGLDGLSQFYYSLDGYIFKRFGPVYQLTWGSYRGDRIGIYNYNDRENKGCINVDYFHYEIDEQGSLPGPGRNKGGL